MIKRTDGKYQVDGSNRVYVELQLLSTFTITVLDSEMHALSAWWLHARQLASDRFYNSQSIVNLMVSYGYFASAPADNTVCATISAKLSTLHEATHWCGSCMDQICAEADVFVSDDVQCIRKWFITEMKNALGHPVSIDAGTEGTDVYVMGIPGTECNATCYLQVCEKVEILKIQKNFNK